MTATDAAEATGVWAVLCKTLCCGCVVQTAGYLLLARIIYEIVSYLWLHFLRPKTNLSKYGAKKGMTDARGTQRTSPECDCD